MIDDLAVHITEVKRVVRPLPRKHGAKPGVRRDQEILARVSGLGAKDRAGWRKDLPLNQILSRFADEGVSVVAASQRVTAINPATARGCKCAGVRRANQHRDKTSSCGVRADGPDFARVAESRVIF